MHLWTPGFEKLWIQQSANSLLTGMNIFDIYFENTAPITWSRKLFKQIVWNINLLTYFILRTMAAKAANCKLKNMVLRMQPFRANATAEMQKRWLQFCFIRIFCVSVIVFLSWFVFFTIMCVWMQMQSCGFYFNCVGTRFENLLQCKTARDFK